MPYIKQRDRESLDDIIATLVKRISDEGMTQVDGRLNYTMTKLVDGLYSPSYFNFNRAIGVLSCVKQEFYRRIIAPYEDVKIEENGDVLNAKDRK